MLRAFVIGWLCMVFCAEANGSWNILTTVSAADFYDAHSGLICDGTEILRVSDTVFNPVFLKPVSAIDIQNTDVAWATDGDTLYIGTGRWSAWHPTAIDTSFTHGILALVRATTDRVFLYSDSELYFSIAGDTLLPTTGIVRGDSIVAIDYFSSKELLAVSAGNIYRSIDGGVTWNVVRSYMSRCASIFVDTAHRLAWVGGDTLFESSDRGLSWNAVLPPLQFALGTFSGQVFGAHDCSGAFYITNGDRNGSNGDIMRSRDAGLTFEDAGPSPSENGLLVRGAWTFDRGSTLYWWASFGFGYGSLFVSHNGADGLVPDSVASAMRVRADTIVDTICTSNSVPLFIHISSSICTGVRIDSISILHARGTIVRAIDPQTLFGNSADIALRYSASNIGTDPIVLRLWFHSLEWKFREHADFGAVAIAVTLPPELSIADSLNFGTVEVGRSRAMTLRIQDSGCSVLRIDSIVSSNPALFELPKLTFPILITRDSTAMMRVSYAPESPGPALESIEIGTNAGHTFVSLYGEGVEAASVASLDSSILTVVPNPTSGGITLVGVSPNEDVQIFDCLGQEVAAGKLRDASGILDDLTNGTYFIRCAGKLARVLLIKR